MGAMTIFEYDVSAHLNSKHKARVFKKIEGCKVALQIDGKVADELKNSKDRDLAATKIVEKAQKVCQAATEGLGKSLAELEAKLEGANSGDKHTLIVGFRTEATSVLKGLESKLKVLPEEQWQKFLAKYGAAKKEYKSYKINAAVNITIGTLGVAASAAAVAGTVHTGGASLVLGVVGMVRSVAKIAETVHVICADVQTYANDLKADCLKLANDFKTSKGKATAKDLAKSAVNTVVGVGFFTTVSTAAKKAELLEGKVAAAVVGGVKLSQEVTKGLDEVDKLEKQMASLKGKDLSKAQEKLQKLAANLSQTFEAAAAMNAKAKTAEQDLKKVRSALAVLKSETALLEKVEIVINVLAEVGLAAATAGVGIEKAGEDALKVAKYSVHLAAELLETAKETLE